MKGWEGTEGPLADLATTSRQEILASYAIRPQFAEEHYNIELAVAEGGYGHRQVYELVQNGADALLRADHPTSGRIEVVLTPEALYCANEGAALNERGLDSLLGSYIAVKRGAEIGRFGLGFKSVLAVTDRPEFFSRTVSLDFDPVQARSQILASGKTSGNEIRHTPGLRIAQVADPDAAADADPMLAELMGWATTVIRLRRTMGDTSWLTTDLVQFPAEFLLFAPHVRNLTLRDLITGARREIHVDSSGAEVRLIEGSRDERWLVFDQTVKPTEAAKSDAGQLARRDELPIAWAVPVSGAAGIGKFWAFFPTTYETTLSGIVNSPWKTNPDRENLLSGAFNEFLLDEAAGLVARNLSLTSSADDPGRHLDLMPARGREARNWADRRVTEKVYQLAANQPSLPDQLGQLQLPADLRIHPEHCPVDALDAWASYPFKPVDWVHRSVERRDRRSRVDRLIETANHPSGQARYSDWLEALAEAKGVESSQAAIMVAALLHTELSPTEFTDVRGARIVLSADGALVAPDPDRLFFGGSPDVGVTTWAVAPEVLADPHAESALREVFGISEVDTSADFAAFVAGNDDRSNALYWERFWTLAGGLSPDEFLQIIGRNALEQSQVRIAAVDGEFRPVCQVLLPGPIVSGISTEAQFTVDEEYHRQHQELLKAVGASSVPNATGGESETWFASYRDWVIGELKSAGISIRDPARIESDGRGAPTHQALLDELNDEGRMRLTRELLRFSDVTNPWHWRGSPSSRESLAVDSPTLWMLRRIGCIDTSLGPRPVTDAVGPGLEPFRRLLPVAVGLSPTSLDAFGLAESIEDLGDDVILGGLERALDEVDDRLIGSYYATVCPSVAAPEQVCCRHGNRHIVDDPQGVTVVSDPDLFVELAAVTPVVLAQSPTAAEQLVERWGMQREEDSVERELRFDAAAPSIPLLDEFPNLRLIPEMEPYRSFQLTRCRSLTQIFRREEGQIATEVDHVVLGEVLYWRQADDAGDSARPDRDLLRFVSQRFGLDLDEAAIEALLQNRVAEEIRKTIELVRNEPDDAHRLLVLVGDDVLRRYVPQPLMAALNAEGRTLEGVSLAEAALAVHGVEILQELRADLDRRGYRPPAQWAGGRAAQSFVRELGFPREYAGWEQPKRAPTLEIDGPIDLPELHDFQATIRRRLRELLRESGKQKRAMLALPTGAGKTRVAVQSLVEHFRDDELTGPVLWIAQTDELCEQAVQTFSEVWRGIGPRRQLVVSRLWASNDAEPVDSPEHVVVATIAKLTASVVENEAYDWLSEASVVIVDEAHESADAPSYTRMLQWLGLGGGSRGQDRCPLIGLTATPFKGVSAERTKQLANRYGGTRLDLMVFGDDEPYRVLQDRGILARVRHQTIEGVAIELEDDERNEFKKFGRLPRAVEARVGADADRNRTLLKSIAQLPVGWPVLFFAASVEHAQAMSALLRLSGVSSAAISAETQVGARRHYIEAFRSGRLRVLTNYGVLTTGFDAPEIRAVYIARPTFSPNLYQQMVGRGLRGPANGGKAECLIVDVEDNVRLFGGKFAFTDFDYLWNVDG